MVDLSTLIEQQAELVQSQQKILISAVRQVQPGQARRGPNDAYLEISKVLASSIDKYATLVTLSRPESA